MPEAHRLLQKSNRLLIFLFVFFFWACGLQSAFAQEPALPLRWSDEGLIGQATQISLREVLRALKSQRDIDIYVDPQLVDTAVSFSFPQPIEAETALKRLLGPHNTAFVYTQDQATNTFRILQVKIFAAGKTDQAGLLHLTAVSPAGDSGSSTDSYDGPHAADYGQSRRLYGQSSVKPFYQPTPGAFGSTRPSRPDGSHGPDYRLNALQRRQVYEEIQQDKANLAHRTQRARQIDARSSHEGSKSAYRSQRNDALHAYLNR